MAALFLVPRGQIPGSLCSRLRRSREWNLASWGSVRKKSSSSGSSGPSAQRATAWRRRSSASIKYAKGNWHEPRCSTSIRRRSMTSLRERRVGDRPSLAAGFAPPDTAMKTTRLGSEFPSLSAEELSSATGEPAERLQQLRSLRLIRPDAEERFASTDIERVRLVQFLERRQIPLETIARVEQDEGVLTSVVAFLYPRGVGRRYSFAQAVDIVRLDADVARRLR